MHKEEVLNDLIDEIVAGRRPTPDDQLARIAGEISCLSEIAPRPEAKSAARELMLSHALRTAGQPVGSWWRRRLTAVIASGMALTMASSGTVYAASGALPGDLLYPVKEATENAALALTPGGQARAEAQVRLARVRLAEIKGLMRRQDKRRIGLAVRALNRRLRLALSEPGLTAAEARSIRAAARSLGPLPNGALAPVPIKKEVPAPALDVGKGASKKVAPARPAETPAPAGPSLTPRAKTVKPARAVVEPERRDRLRRSRSNRFSPR